MKTVIDVVRVKNWDLSIWTPLRCWRWMPRVETLWSGKLVYYQWMMFSLCHDKRGGPLSVIADIAGKSEVEMAAKLDAIRVECGSKGWGKTERLVELAEQRGFERGVKALRDALKDDSSDAEWEWIASYAAHLLDAESGDAE